MIITEANISMSAEYKQVTEYTKTERFEFWVNRQGQGTNLPPVILDLSDPGQAGSLEENKMAEIREEEVLTPKLSLIKRLVEEFTGRKIRIVSLKKFCAYSKGTQEHEGASVEEEPEGWGLVYSSHQRYQESQELIFSSHGVIRTRDGQEIAFNLDLQFQREFFAQEDFTLRAGDAKKIDPLVVNFDGLASELTDLKFDFDLDADGSSDKISFTKPGSGFLALDRNQDGLITDGSELFGPTTGDGFSELGLFDQDNNQWIDEGDPVFSELQVWTKDQEGKDTLRSLYQLGIGAISLQNIGTRFDLKNTENLLVGQTKKLGVFVRENGTPGCIQQVDLVV